MKEQHTPAHTPGPWVVLRHVGIYAGKDLVASIHSPIPEPTKSNARLIAAAPDLLAVVQELQESAGYWSEYDVPIGIVDRINAAIELATKGRP